MAVPAVRVLVYIQVMVIVLMVVSAAQAVREAQLRPGEFR